MSETTGAPVPAPEPATWYLKLESGFVFEVPEGVTEEQMADLLTDLLIDFVEARGWTLGGSMKLSRVDDEGEPL